MEKSDTKYNSYAAKINTSFFKDMTITFSDYQLRYLDKNYYLPKYPDYKKLSYDEYEKQLSNYEKREEYLETAIKKASSCRNKANYS